MVASTALTALLTDTDEARALLGGIGRTRLFEMLKTGELPSVKIGRRRMVLVSDIEAYVERLRDEQVGAPAA